MNPRMEKYQAETETGEENETLKIKELPEAGIHSL